MNPLYRNKRLVLLALLEHNNVVYVHLDPRLEGVEVPLQFRRTKALMLKYGYNLTPAIPRLEIDNDGISALLSFSGMPSYTFVPWSAVFGIGPPDGAAFVYHDAFPADLTLQSLGIVVRPRIEAVSKDAVPEDVTDSPVPTGPFVPRIVA